MALITATDVRARIPSLPDEVVVNAALEQAILSSQPMVEALVGSPLDSASYQDIFILDRALMQPMMEAYALRLRAGFLVEGSVVVTMGMDYDALLNAPATIVASQYKVVPAKGFVHLMEPSELYSGYRRNFRSFDNHWAKVSYTAGFAADAVLPGWLVEVWACRAIKLLVAQQVTEQKPEFLSMLKILEEQVSFILRDNRRAHPFSMAPSM